MSLTVIKNATCTFCGCVCDDIELHADEDRRRVTVLSDDERPVVFYGDERGDEEPLRRKNREDES